MGSRGWIRAGGLAAEVPPARILSFLGLGTKATLQTTLAELGETRAKVLRQESALKELQERGEGRGLEPWPQQ